MIRCRVKHRKETQDSYTTRVRMWRYHKKQYKNNKHELVIKGWCRNSRSKSCFCYEIHVTRRDVAYKVDLTTEKISWNVFF